MVDKIEQIQRWENAINNLQHYSKNLNTWSRPNRWTDGIWEEEVALIKGQLDILTTLREIYNSTNQEDEDEAAK